MPVVAASTLSIVIAPLLAGGEVGEAVGADVTGEAVGADVTAATTTGVLSAAVVDTPAVGRDTTPENAEVNAEAVTAVPSAAGVTAKLTITEPAA